MAGPLARQRKGGSSLASYSRWWQLQSGPTTPRWGDKKRMVIFSCGRKKSDSKQKSTRCKDVYYIVYGFNSRRKYSFHSMTVLRSCIT